MSHAERNNIIKNIIAYTTTILLLLRIFNHLHRSRKKLKKNRPRIILYIKKIERVDFSVSKQVSNYVTTR